MRNLILSLEQVSDHQSEVWISKYALYTDPHNNNVVAEINAIDLTLMKTMQGYIWMEEPHRYSYRLNICLQLISNHPMHDVDPNAVVNDWLEAVND